MKQSICKKTISIMLSLVLVLAISSTAFASDTEEEQNINEVDLHSLVLITDDITGEETVISTQNVEKNTEVLSDNSITEESTVTFSSATVAVSGMNPHTITVIVYATN